MKWKRISKQKTKVFCYWADSSSRVSLSRRESETFFNFTGLRLTWQLWHFTRHTILLIPTTTTTTTTTLLLIHISPLLEIEMFAPFRLAADWKPDVKRFLLFQCQQSFVSTLRSEFCFDFKIVGKSSGRRYAHVYYPALARTLFVFVFVFCRRFWAEGNKNKCNQSTHPGR
jgi:hypothetical protein